MTNIISFDDLLNKIKAHFPATKNALSLYDIASQPELYDIFAPEYDGYFSVLVCCSNELAVQQMISFLNNNHFKVLGNKDIYGAKQLLDILNDQIAKGNSQLASSSYYEQLKEETNTTIEAYGYDEASKAYYFYFIPYNSDCPTWFHFRNDMIPQLVSIVRKNNVYATCQFNQSDKIVHNKAVMNITVKGDDGKPEYVYYFDNLHVFINDSFEDFRAVFSALSLIYKIAENEEDFNSVCNGINLYHLENK